MAAEVAQLEAGDPHSVTSRPGEQQPAEPERVAQLARVRAAASLRRLELGDLRLEVADERAEDGVRRGERALRQRRHRAVAHAELEEPVGELGLDLVDVDVQLVRPDADQLDVEHEVRIGAFGELRDEARAASRPSRRRAAMRSNRVLPTLRSSTVTRFLPSVASRLTSRTLPARSWSSAIGSGAPE